MNALIIQVVLLQGTRKIVLHKNVAVFGQFMQDLDAGGILKGQAYRLFVAVDLTAIRGMKGSRYVDGHTDRK